MIPKIRVKSAVRLLKARRMCSFLISYGRRSNGSFKSSRVEIFKRFSRMVFMPNSAVRNLYKRIAPLSSVQAIFSRLHRAVARVESNLHPRYVLVKRESPGLTVRCHRIVSYDGVPDTSPVESYPHFWCSKIDNEISSIQSSANRSRAHERHRYLHATPNAFGTLDQLNFECRIHVGRAVVNGPAVVSSDVWRRLEGAASRHERGASLNVTEVNSGE